MADVTVNYKGSAIAELSASGSATLETAGKFCEDDIEVVYAGGGGSDFKQWIYTHGSADTQSGWVSLLTDSWLAQHRNDNNLVVVVRRLSGGLAQYALVVITAGNRTVLPGSSTLSFQSLVRQSNNAGSTFSVTNVTNALADDNTAIATGKLRLTASGELLYATTSTFRLFANSQYSITAYLEKTS